MNSLKPVFTMLHPVAVLKRLLVAAFAVLLLGTFTIIPTQAAGSGTWTITGSLLTARANHTATLLQNGKVLVASGTSAELYDSSTGVWTTTGDLHTSRSAHTATLLQNGQVLVTGGFGVVNGQYVGLTSAELYDPSAGTWTTTGDLRTGRINATATLLQNGQVLVAGGYYLQNSSVAIAVASAELYNPATGTWTTTGSMSTSREFHTATLLQNGQVLVAGGVFTDSTGSQFGYLSSAELYNPATGTWAITGSMSTTRSQHTATLLQNGQVLVAAGTNLCCILSSAELYNPSTGTWATTGSLSTARYNHTATLLTNGQVLVAGGETLDNYGCPIVFSSAELYNPGTGVWTTTGSLNQARDSHTATLLSNGQVLVAGGSYAVPDCVSFSTLTSAELYTP